MQLRLGLSCVLWSVVIASPAYPLEPRDVFVLANRAVQASREVAEHYCRVRGVPADHVIALDLPAGEDITRQDYDGRLAGPLRTALQDRREQARVLVTTYDVPLRVGPPAPTPEEKAQLAELKPQVEAAQAEQKRLQDQVAAAEAEAKKAPSGESARLLPQYRRDLAAARERLRPLLDRQRRLGHAESQACVDSELSLLWWGDYELRRWQLNPLNQWLPEGRRPDRPAVLMVSRLDGPTPALARQLVDRAVAAEKDGLRGRAYFDARGIKYDPDRDTGHGYGGYDESLREAARLLQREAKLDVTLDDRPELFAPGSCPDCALYCGWYSLAKYVDCCRFVPGAVAYHIASSEAVSLRNPQGKYWCKCLLEDGVAATLGPVAEPYTVGFPKPAEFFGLLVTGRYPLVECYYRTAHMNSWMTVLVGDPLYNPYARDRRLTPEQVSPSPRGGKPFGERR